MRIAVMGLEDFGFHLARVLTNLGDEVMAVDRDEVRVQEIMRHVSKAVVADVADREALKDLGIRGMDVVAVDVGERFETSVLLTHYLRELGIPRVLALRQVDPTVTRRGHYPGKSNGPAQAPCSGNSATATMSRR